MRKVTSRFFSLVLSALMICSLFATTAFAAETKTTVTITNLDSTSVNWSNYTFPAGTNFIFCNGTTGNKFLWTEDELTEEQQTLVAEALAEETVAMKTIDAYFNGYGTITLTGSKSADWSFTKNDDGTITIKAESTGLSFSGYRWGTLTITSEEEPEESDITLYEYAENDWTTVTLEEADSTTGAPAGTYSAVPVNQYAVVCGYVETESRGTRYFGVVFGVGTAVSDELKSAIMAADTDNLIYDTDTGNPTFAVYCSGGTHYKVAYGDGYDIYYGYEKDGITYVLIPESAAVKVILTDVEVTFNTKTSVPSIDKDISADGSSYDESTLSGSVTAGSAVYFRLESNLPETLVDNASLSFTDTMSANLTLNDGMTVTIGEKEIDEQYYTVSDVDSDGTFTVTLDLASLYAAGRISDSDLSGAANIVVTYSATVSSDAEEGDTISNTAYVTYNGDDSVESTVTGSVTGSTTPDDPSTGGTGTTLFTIGGLALIAGAGIGAEAMRRRRAKAKQVKS